MAFELRRRRCSHDRCEIPLQRMPRCPLPEAAAIKEPHARRTGGQGGCDRRTAGSAPVIDLSDRSELPSRPVRNMTSAMGGVNALQPEQQQTLIAQMYKINAPLLLAQGTSEVTRNTCWSTCSTATTFRCRSRIRRPRLKPPPPRRAGLAHALAPNRPALRSPRRERAPAAFPRVVEGAPVQSCLHYFGGCKSP
jgi:hypothetical protein